MRINRRPAAMHGLFVLVSLALALSALAASQLATLAQDTPDITFRVAKYTCEEDPGQISPVADNAPDDCELTEGVTFTIAVEGAEGDPLTCTTDATGQCSVQVPSEAMVTVTEDTSTAPDGYAPRENPIETQAVTEFAGAVFVNLPEGNGETPSELPDTGTGTVAQVASHGAAGMLAVLAAVVMISGALVRRPDER